MGRSLERSLGPDKRPKMRLPALRACLKIPSPTVGPGISDGELKKCDYKVNEALT